MEFKVELSPLAEIELWAAVDWYDEQLPDLGKAIQQNPNQFPKILRSKRQAVLHKFPYVIIFEVSQNTIYILAIFHTSRDPANFGER